VVETMSRARAARARELLESVAGTALRCRLVEHESVERALERRDRRPAPARSREAGRSVDRELEHEVVSKFLTEHYRKWVDAPIPALGGRTPRHAARLKSARPALVVLLKELERAMARDKSEGRPSIDLGWVWAELGLSEHEET